MNKIPKVTTKEENGKKEKWMNMKWKQVLEVNEKFSGKEFEKCKKRKQKEEYWNK